MKADYVSHGLCPAPNTYHRGNKEARYENIYIVGPKNDTAISPSPAITIAITIVIVIVIILVIVIVIAIAIVIISSLSYRHRQVGPLLAYLCVAIICELRGNRPNSLILEGEIRQDLAHLTWQQKAPGVKCTRPCPSPRCI